MKHPLIIFGVGDVAQLAHYYFTRDTNFEVKAFTVDAAYIQEPTFCGLPVVPFDTVEETYPAASHMMFIAMGYARLNQVRREKFEAAKEKGYLLASYVSPHATLNDNPIGENCFIFEDNTVQPFVSIGHNVTLWSGNHVGHHSVIEDHVFVASHVVISGGCRIGEASFLGVNCTLRDRLNIGKRCVIGAGALLLADAPDESVYIGAATEASPVPSSRLRKL